jgi:hypothetical protein
VPSRLVHSYCTEIFQYEPHCLQTDSIGTGTLDRHRYLYLEGSWICRQKIPMYRYETCYLRFRFKSVSKSPDPQLFYGDFVQYRIPFLLTSKNPNDDQFEIVYTGNTGTGTVCLMCCMFFSSFFNAYIPGSGSVLKKVRFWIRSETVKT